jgi:uncharacterized membrane protein
MSWIWERRFLVIALLAALALNLFLGSVIAGHWMQPEPRIWNAAAIIERRAERLPEADAAVLRATFAEHREALERHFEALRASRAQARAAAGRAPFDRRALAAALADVRSRTDALQRSFHDLYLDVAPQISADGREALFERWRGSARE